MCPCEHRRDVLRHLPGVSERRPGAAPSEHTRSEGLDDQTRRASYSVPMPPLAKYKYTRQPSKLGRILREAPRTGRPKEISVAWLRSGYGVSNNEGSIISVLRFIGLVRPDGTPTDLWDAIREPTAQNRIRFADAVRAAYDDLFTHYPDAHREDDETLRTFFRGQELGGTQVQGAVLTRTRAQR
jgi:hypothetical protein